MRIGGWEGGRTTGEELATVVGERHVLDGLGMSVERTQAVAVCIDIPKLANRQLRAQKGRSRARKDEISSSP